MIRALSRSSRRASKALSEAETLEAEGRSLEAIELLNEANRADRSARIESALVRIRHRAFSGLGQPGSSHPVPGPIEAGEDPGADGLPSIDAAKLTARTVRGAILSHGSLIVRGLIDPDRAGELRDGIDRSFDAAARHAGGADREATSPWYDPFVPEPQFADAVELGRSFVGGGSGIWTADSPRMLFELLECYEGRMREIVTEYLGERPAISVNKGTLRRARPEVGTEWWHQDGAFLGDGIRSLNIWLALNDCGETAPGMEVVPKRLGEIVECGTRGADFDWSVGQPVVDEVSGGDSAWPVFSPGDALLFDHLCLHRTGCNADMTDVRYATETWFFAPSAYPDPATQVPLAF